MLGARFLLHIGRGRPYAELSARYDPRDPVPGSVECPPISAVDCAGASLIVGLVASALLLVTVPLDALVGRVYGATAVILTRRGRLPLRKTP